MTTSLLPPNATAQELALESATARIGDVPVPIKDVWNPDTCPANVLPFLAWAFSVDYWNAAWPVAIQRKVVAAAIAVHRVKGTLGAVEDALAALDLDVVVTEWFDYAGTPYTFKVDVELTTRGLDQAEADAAEAVALNAKNTRSHIDAFNIWLTSKTATPVCGILAHYGEIIEVLPYSIDQVDAETAAPFFGSSAATVEVITVNPQGA